MTEFYRKELQPVEGIKGSPPLRAMRLPNFPCAQENRSN